MTGIERALRALRRLDTLDYMGPTQRQALAREAISALVGAPKGPATFEQCVECAAYDPDALCPQRKCTPAA